MTKFWLLLLGLFSCNQPQGLKSANGIFMLDQESIHLSSPIYGQATIAPSSTGFKEWTDTRHYYLRLADTTSGITVTFETTDPYKDTNYLVQLPDERIDASGNILYASYVSPKDTSVADSGYVHFTSPSPDSLAGYYRLYMGGNGLGSPSDPSRIISGRIVLARAKK